MRTLLLALVLAVGCAPTPQAGRAEPGRCVDCDVEVRVGRSHCDGCLSRRKLATCERCDAEIPAGTRFCPECKH